MTIVSPIRQILITLSLATGFLISCIAECKPYYEDYTVGHDHTEDQPYDKTQNFQDVIGYCETFCKKWDGIIKDISTGGLISETCVHAYVVKEISR